MKMAVFEHPQFATSLSRVFALQRYIFLKFMDRTT